MDVVDLSRVGKELKNRKKIPFEITDVLQSWVEQVEKFGLFSVQKIIRFKDHALKGSRNGERSISLSYQWRAIYTVKSNGKISIVMIEEITPHDYRKK